MGSNPILSATFSSGGFDKLNHRFFLLPTLPELVEGNIIHHFIRYLGFREMS
jgi:hypothetical protein